MRASHASRRSGLSPRRKLLFALLALALAYLGYAWYAGLAFTAGIEERDMDWNADGEVTSREILQSMYAVTVRTTREGPRTCRSFYWRGREDGDPISVACKTEVGEAQAR